MAAAGIDPFQHYLDYGWREGRAPSSIFSVVDYWESTGLNVNFDPLIHYLSGERYFGINRDTNGEYNNINQIIEYNNGSFQSVLVGNASLFISNNIARLDATAHPLSGHDLSNVRSYHLTKSTADIVVDGSGLFPNYLYFGNGNDSIYGNFDLNQNSSVIDAGKGSLKINATFNNGLIQLKSIYENNIVNISGNAQIFYEGSSSTDSVILGSGNDYVSVGDGINYIDGGLGIDKITWDKRVFADLSKNIAYSVDGNYFNDTILGDYPLPIRNFCCYIMGHEQEAPNNRAVFQAVSR